MNLLRTRRLIVLGLLVFAWLAMTAAAGVKAQLPKEEMVRLSLSQPEEATPITIDADEIASWTEGDQNILLVRGQVLVQQGIARVRFQEGLFILDLKQFQINQVWNIGLYAEKEVVVQNGAEVKKGSRAYLDLRTRGELKLNSHKSAISKQVQGNDPLFLRALEQRAASKTSPTRPSHLPATGISASAVTNPIKPASYTTTPLADSPSLPPISIPGTSPTSTPPATVPGTPGPTPPPGPTTPPLSVAPSPTMPPAIPGSTAPAGPASGGLGGSGLLGGALPGATPTGPAPLRQYSIVPRTLAGFQSQVRTMPSGEKAVMVTGGFVLNVRSIDPQGRPVDMLDIEADRLVLWTRGDAQQLFNNLSKTPQGTQTNRELEFYLAGNVEIRSRSGKDDRILRADEVYYDVSRNVAVAVSADLELRQPGVPDPIHFKADELEQISPTLFRALRGEFFASRLPSDPGLKVVFTHATLEERQRPRRSLFSKLLINRPSEQPETVTESIVRAESVFLRLEDTPIFYLPFVQGDARDPLGPVRSIHLGYNQIFGAQIGLGIDMHDLLGIDPLPGTRWRTDVDYLSKRGPALGTSYDFLGKDLFGMPGRYTGQIFLWGINDQGTDNLGGGRGQFDDHPDWRGRATAKINAQDLPAGFSFQGQVFGLSDKNLYEQYYKREFDEDPNAETFIYLKQQRGNWAWTFLTEPRIRNWVTETEWLPRVDGYLLGQSFLDQWFTYNIHGSAGYARLLTPNVPPPPFAITDQRDDTGRFDVMQELSLPLILGPVKVVPYGVLDLTYYTQDLNGDSRGRLYGGGGVRASMPLTHPYPQIQSLLWNLNGINHKIVLCGNYCIAGSSDPYSLFPQLDRLNDDATDQSQRDIRPVQSLINPSASNGLFLARSPLFDPQVYAIRRLVDNRVDTLDTINVLQLELRQRWQTKRGFPGQQHIIDWMTLDLSASLFPENGRSSTWPYPVIPPGDPGNPATFPNAQRDNFDQLLAFLEYDWTWNIGDRTALVSSGWVDPIDQGPRVFTFGAFLNRPDRTNFYVGYRQIDPVGSKAVSGALTYVFSPKYAITATSVYDFGTQQSLSNSLVFTRMGSDLQLSLGFSYNAMQNNFGFVFEIVPNLVPQNRRLPGLALGPGSVLGR